MSLKTLINKFSDKEIDYTLIGCLLGDGSMTGNKTRVSIQHTNRQRDYVKFKEDLFTSLGCKVSSRYDFSMDTTFGRYEYSSVSIKPKSVGRIKEKSLEYLLKRITPLGLLLWWLDDGSLTVSVKKSGSVCRFGYLHTQAYDYQQHLLLVRLFKEIFDLDVKINKDIGGANDKHKVYYRLYLNATNFRKFIDIFYDYIPFIPECMKYKLNMKYVKNKVLRSEEFMRYNF